MAGAVITVTLEGFERVFAVTDKLSNPQWDQLLRIIGLTIEAQTKLHFQQQGGPEGPWPGTNRGGQILVLTGRLRDSIAHALLSDNEVAIGTNVFYGRFHQEGTRYTPTRKFLGLTESDKDELTKVIETYIDGLMSG